MKRAIFSLGAIFVLIIASQIVLAGMSSVTVISPNGGEHYGYGYSETPEVIIQYYTPTPVIRGYKLVINSCNPELPYDDNCKILEEYEITAGGTAYYYYDWDVRSEMASDNYKIKAEVWHYENEEWVLDSQDKSDAMFSLHAGLMAHWQLDEATGTTVYDNAKNNDGTIQESGYVDWENGIMHSGLELNDREGYVEVPYRPHLNLEHGYAIEMFVRDVQGGQSDSRRIGKQKTGTGFVYEVMIEEDRIWTQFVNSTGHSFGNYWDVDLSGDEWIHVSGMYDGEKIWITVDGDVVRALDRNGNDVMASTDPFLIGYNIFGASSGYENSFDEIRVWDRPIAASKLHYNTIELEEKINSGIETITEPDVHIGPDNRVWIAYEDTDDVYLQYKDHDGWIDRAPIFANPASNEFSAQVHDRSNIIAVAAINASVEGVYEVVFVEYPRFPPFITPFYSEVTYISSNELSNLSLQYVGSEYLLVWREYNPITEESAIKSKRPHRYLFPEPITWAEIISDDCPTVFNRFPSTCYEESTGKWTVLWSCRYELATERYSLYETTYNNSWSAGQEVRREDGILSVEKSSCTYDNSGTLWAFWERYNSVGYVEDKLLTSDVKEETPYVEIVAVWAVDNPGVAHGASGELWYVWDDWDGMYDYDVIIERFDPVTHVWSDQRQLGGAGDDVRPVISGEPFFLEPVVIWARGVLGLDGWYTTIPQ